MIRKASQEHLRAFFVWATYFSDSDPYESPFCPSVRVVKKFKSKFCSLLKCKEICKLLFPFDKEDANGNFVADTCEKNDVDDDKDGIPNSEDNCPKWANSNQNDEDLDGCINHQNIYNFSFL